MRQLSCFRVAVIIIILDVSVTSFGSHITFTIFNQENSKFFLIKGGLSNARNLNKKQEKYCVF